MIILNKRSELLAQSEILIRFMSYAKNAFPDQIDSVLLDDLQCVIAAFYNYSDWTKLVFDLNPINANKLLPAITHTQINIFIKSSFDKKNQK